MKMEELAVSGTYRKRSTKKVVRIKRNTEKRGIERWNVERRQWTMKKNCEEAEDVEAW